MNFIHDRSATASNDGGVKSGDKSPQSDLSSVRSKVRRNSLLAKKRALSAAMKLDPRVDFQAQIRPSLNMRLEDVLRPEVHSRPSSPGLDYFDRAPSPRTVRVSKNTTPSKKPHRKSVALVVNPKGLGDQHMASPESSASPTSPSYRDELSPIFDRLASPENFTGIYRRRSVVDPLTGRLDGRINHETDLSASVQHSVGQTYTGSNNTGTGEKITDIAQVMRPWLRPGKGQRIPTTLAFSDHEVKRRATILGLKGYADVYRQKDGKMAGVEELQQQGPLRQDGGRNDILSLGPLGRISAAQKSGGIISSAQKELCFERLSDASLFVGIHRHRFDPITRQGRGKAGSDVAAKGIGHVPGGQRLHILSRPQKSTPRIRSYYNPAPRNPNSVKDSARREVERLQAEAARGEGGRPGGDSSSPLGDSFWELSDPKVDWAARKMRFQEYHTLRSGSEEASR